MKTLKFIIVLFAVILYGFSRDSQTDKTEAGIAVPMQFWGGTIPDASGGFTACSGVIPVAHHKYGWIQGHQTHGGKLIPELSPYEIVSCETNLSTGLNISQIVGEVTVANGDSYTYTCVMTVNIFTDEAILTINITSGKGRFEGAAGEITLTGTHVEGSISFSGEGFITFQK